MWDDPSTGSVTHSARTVGGGAGSLVAAGERPRPHVSPQCQAGRCARILSRAASLGTVNPRSLVEPPVRKTEMRPWIPSPCKRRANTDLVPLRAEVRTLSRVLGRRCSIRRAMLGPRISWRTVTVVGRRIML